MSVLFASMVLAGAASPSTVILTYHDFVERRDAGSLWFDCTPSEFERQIEWLKAHGAHFVTLDQVYSHLVNHSVLPSHSVALTAADGYEGFYLHALPLLRRYKIPLTMFVHTGYVGGTQGRPKMTWAQLRALQREGLVSIQSQTVSHPADLGQLADAQIKWELEQSRRQIESHLHSKVKYLAYPNGKFDSRCEAMAQVSGYLMAFSEVTRPAEESPSHWAVNRYVHTKWRQAWKDAHRDERLKTNG